MKISLDHFQLLYDLADSASAITSLKAKPQFKELFNIFYSKKGVNKHVVKM